MLECVACTVWSTLTPYDIVTHFGVHVIFYGISSVWILPTVTWFGNLHCVHRNRDTDTETRFKIF